MWEPKGLYEVDTTTERNFQCFLCSEKFALASDLAIHIENHEIQRAFRCGFCDESFHENSELLAHISLMHEGLPNLYNCGICKLTFQVLLALEQHIAGCKRNMSSNLGYIKGETKYEQTDSDCSFESKRYVSPLNEKHDIILISTQIALLNKITNGLSQKMTKDQKSQEVKYNGKLDVSGLDHVSSDLIEQGEGSIIFKNSGTGDNLIFLSNNFNEPDKVDLTFKCKTCSKSYNDLEAYSLHMCPDDLDRFFGISCVKCNSFFEDMDTFEHHFTDTECEGWKCPLCPKSFSLEASLLKHSVFHHKYKQSCDKKCSKCYKTFVLASDWADHEATHAKSLPFVCMLCNKHLRSVRAIRTYHLPFAHAFDPRLKGQTKGSPSVENNQPSVGANLMAQPNNGLSKNQLLVGANLIAQPSNSLSNTQTSVVAVEKNWKCNICSQQCNDKKDLHQHNKTHAIEECYAIQCVKCNCIFENVELLETHIKSTVCPGLKCSMCSQSFGLEACLLKHNILAHKHGPEVNNICRQCGKTCLTRRAWARHEATHAKSKPFACKICGKQFSTLDQLLRSHMPGIHDIFKVKHKQNKNSDSVFRLPGSDIENSVHNKQKIIKESLARNLHQRKARPLNGRADTNGWECNVCRQDFNTEEKLNDHLRSHAIDDCYSIQCVLCFDYFENTELLEKHLESTDCSGFECEICHELFGLESHWIRHLFMAHEKTLKVDFICSQCGKKCQSHAAWARHEATHVVSQQFFCKICGKHFSTKDNVLRCHLTNVHKLQYKKTKTNCVSKVPTSQVKKKCFKTTNSPANTRIKKILAPKVKVCIDCDICGGKVSDQQALIAHRSHHFMTNKFTIQCSGCPEKFSQMRDLISHVNGQHCSKYTCVDCNQVFPTELNFVIHNLKSHTFAHPSGQYKCQKCNKNYESFTAYVDHASEHVNSKPFQCKICNSTFMSEILLEKHLEEAHTLIKNVQESITNSYKCVQCLETFKTKMALMVHTRFHIQREVLSENKEDANKPDSSFASYMTSFFCQLCSVGFGGASHLDRHDQMHMAVNRPKCTICGMLFKQNSSLTAHMDHHNKPYLCTSCGKTFPSSQTLTQHNLAYHSAVNPYQCKVCLKFYSGNGALTHHMKCHTGVKRYECKTCGQQFRDTNGLKSHILIHSKEKRYGCKVCNYRCRHKHCMERHMDMHNGVKRFNCTYCGKAFRAPSGLKAHLTIHTGQKKYACEYCGRCFARRNYLNVHTLTHTKEKPISCPLCGNRFAVRSNLNVHVRKVHGEKHFKHLKAQKALSRKLEIFSWPLQEMSAGEKPTNDIDATDALQPTPAQAGLVPMTSAISQSPENGLDNGSNHSVDQQSQQIFYM